MLVRERLMMDSDFKRLLSADRAGSDQPQQQSQPKTASAKLFDEIVMALTERAIIDLSKTGWNGRITATEAMAVDLETAMLMDLLRSSVCAELAASGAEAEARADADAEARVIAGRVRSALRELIRRDRVKAEAGMSEKEAEPEPNWPMPCRKCGKMAVYFWSVQTRSCDEPSTLFFRCLDCGRQWRSA